MPPLYYDVSRCQSLYPRRREPCFDSVPSVSEQKARFHVGQLVHHLRFGYRGVIVDVDPQFQLSEEWYEEVARSRPPKDRPWYHVLVHEADQMTYVAERHLEPDLSGAPVRHPLLSEYFSGFENVEYQQTRQVH